MKNAFKMFGSVDKKIYCGFLESKSYTFWVLCKSCQTQKKNLSPTCVQLRLGKTERKFYKENIIRCEGKANAKCNSQKETWMENNKKLWKIEQ